jgi:hypothetical protein
LNLVAFLGEFADDGRPRRLGQAADFVAGIVADPRSIGKRDADQDRLLGRDGKFVPLVVECLADEPILRGARAPVPGLLTERDTGLL